MPNIKSAKKRVELTQDRAQKNNILKTTLKTALKKFDSSLESGNKEEINNAYKAAVSTVDKVASKGVIKKFKTLNNTYYGENLVNDKNPKETQPMYYEDKFKELLEFVGVA